jgi:hypothetical protein
LAIKNLFETSPLRLLNNFPFWQTEKEKKRRSSKTCKHRCFLITNKNANLMMMYSNEGKMGEWMMCLGGWKESNKFIKYLLLMVGRINDGGKKAEFITHYETNFLYEIPR